MLELWVVGDGMSTSPQFETHANRRPPRARSGAPSKKHLQEVVGCGRVWSWVVVACVAAVASPRPGEKGRTFPAPVTLVPGPLPADECGLGSFS